MGQTVVSHESVLESPLGELIEGELEASAATRVEIWRGAIQMIRENPWWGVGYGAFPHLIQRYVDRPIGYADAHNSYFLIAAEMGMPTLVVFLIILLLAMRSAAWLYKRTGDPATKAIALGFLGGLGGLLVVNLFGSRMDDQAVSSYFWILLGLVMRAIVIERQQPCKTRSA
jgi:O-antigen ligase